MFVVYHKEFPRQDRRWFATHAGARRSATCSNRHLDEEKYMVVDETEFEKLFPVTMKKVKNLMTGQEIEIPSDTPNFMDPSRESYWSI